MLLVIIGCIIQARMSSTRLPGKVLMRLNEKNTVLDYVIQQIKHCKNFEKIIIATTDLKEDDVICEHLASQKIEFFRGSSEDVLDRYYQCAKLYSLSIIVRITGDNPLIDPNIVENVLMEFQSRSCDYVSNAVVRSFPYGTETEVFSFDALEKAWNNAKKDNEREHVTPYFYNNPEKFRIYHVENQKNLSSLRWTVDQIEDFILVKNIVSKINKSPILMNDIINLLTEEPKLLDINKNIIHKHIK